MTPRNDTQSETESNSAPVDLAAVAALTVATVVLELSPLDGTPLSPLVGFPFLLVTPGYALVSALFPSTDGVSGVDRLAFSIGTSVTIVAAVSVALNFSPWPIGLRPIVLSIGGVTLGLTALAVVRRRSLPPARRYSVPYRKWTRAAGSIDIAGSRRNLALNAVLALAVLIAASGLVYALTAPDRGKPHTEMYLLSENESGDLVAGDYPQEFAREEAGTLYLGIANQERETVEYTVVAELQRTEPADGGVRVVERERLNEFEVTLSDGETWRSQRTVRPTMTGDDLRLTYMLYRGEPPAEPTRENAYRTVDLRISVS